MAENVAKITFLGIDKVSGIAKQVTNNVSSSMQTLSLAGKNVFNSFTNLSSSIGNFGREIRGIGFLIAGLGLSTYALVKSYTGFVEQLSISARITGLTTQAFQGLSAAAGKNKISAEELTNSLGFLLRAKVKALRDPESEEALAFTAVGLDAVALASMSTEQMMLAVADAFSKSTNVAAKQAVAFKLLGRASKDMFAFLDLGGTVINKSIEEVRRYSVMLGDDAVKAGLDFNNTMGNLSIVMEGFKTLIVQSLMPHIKPMIDAFNNWFAVNKEIIALRIDKFIQDAAIELKGLWGALKNIAGIIWGVVEGLGGLKGVLYAIIGLKLAGLVASIINIGLALKNLGVALLVLSANPIVLIIAAIAALGVGIYLVYKNWDFLKAKFLAIWPQMKTTFEAFANLITLGVYGLVKSIIVNWDAIKTFWYNMIDGIKNKFNEFIDYIFPANSAIVIGVKAIWAELKLFFDGFWPSLVPAFESFMNVITLRIYGLVKLINKLLNIKMETPGLPGVKNNIPAGVSAGGSSPFANAESSTISNPFLDNRVVPIGNKAAGVAAKEIGAPETEAAPIGQQLVRLFVNMKIDSEGRPKDIKTSSNIPLDFEANTGVVV